jgi:hypothetical protein
LKLKKKLLVEGFCTSSYLEGQWESLHNFGVQLDLGLQGVVLKAQLGYMAVVV